MAYPPADELLRGLTFLAGELTSRIPADAIDGSPRHHEEARLRVHSNTRAGLLRDLSIEVAVLIAGVRLMIEGVADCFELAGQRDNLLHGAATAVTLRPALELAGPGRLAARRPDR